MKAPYTYTVLRYVHDVVTGEFVNVGVILYSASAGFLRAQVTTSASRIKRFFGRVDSDYLRDLFRHIERAVAHAAQHVGPLSLRESSNDVATYAEALIPRDDSALQLSPVAGGLTDDPQLALTRLFDRYVNKYRAESPKSTRQDQEILPIFKRSLEEKDLLAFVQSKVIEAPDYEHEFPVAWKNGVWNACDAVSFDLAEAGDIIEKANKWLGRATNLSESAEPFRLILLVGEPRRVELARVVAKAETIIRKADLEVVTVSEREAPRLAEMVARDVVH